MQQHTSSISANKIVSRLLNFIGFLIGWGYDFPSIHQVNSY